MINAENFVANLRYMGLGMLGIMVVIGIIIGVTYLLNLLSSSKNEGNK